MSSLLALVAKYLIGFLGIGLVVVIHEIGHFIAATLSGIGVEVFSFGLGPKLWGRSFKGTDFRISAFPLGGYCRLKGSDDLRAALAQHEKSFTHIEDGSLFSVHPAKRIVTYLAGPLLNIMFAILLYAVLASLPYSTLSTDPVIATVNDYPSLFVQASSPAHQMGLRTSDRVLLLNGEKVPDWESLEARLEGSEGMQMFAVERDGQMLLIPVVGEKSAKGVRYGITVIRPPIIGGVRPATPEAEAGLSKGDRILSANGVAVANDLDLLVALASDTEKTELLVQREEGTSVITFRPDLDERGKGEWNFSLAAEKRPHKGSPFSLSAGWRTTVRMTKDTLTSLLLLIRGERGDVRQEFTGAARAALMIGDITALALESSAGGGLRALGYLLGVVSISLGLANLLPLPAFDGGQIVVALYEWATGRHIRPKTYWILQLAGIGIVVGIFFFLGFADMVHFLSIRR
ncbi:MAG: RIP metalloprotease RseP [Sphaerochaeta sp.]|nr:RIP metalloprotease RseP [Sphaerochaeta sp.]